MEVMGVDPIERLVAPRLLATVVVALILNGVVAFAGTMTGYITSILVLHGSAGGFLESFSSFAQPSDFIESMMKAAVFGVLAAVVASNQGLKASRGPGPPRSLGRPESVRLCPRRRPTMSRSSLYRFLGVPLAVVALGGCGLSLQTLPKFSGSLGSTYPIHATFSDVLNCRACSTEAGSTSYRPSCTR